MITHTKASAYMNTIIGLAVRNMRTDGYAYPIVVALSLGEDRCPSLSHDLIVSDVCHVFKNLSLVAEPAFDPEPHKRLYAHLYLLSFNRIEDEPRIKGILNSLAREGQPDALGYVCSCMYNIYDDCDNVSARAVLNDPEAVRMLYMSYYRNGDRRRRDLVIPFISHGKRSRAAAQLPGEESSGGYDMLMAHGGWFCPTPQAVRNMKYPFVKESGKERRRACDRKER
jgi:hypothetical protein